MKLPIKIIIIILIFAAGFLLGWQVALAPADGQPVLTNQNAGEIKTDLAIDFGGGRIQNYNQIAMPEGSSVFDLLKKAAAENNLALDYKDYGGEMGVFINSIDNIKNALAGDTFWQFWINGQYSQVGASSYKLKDGDKVEWRYIKGQID